MFYSVPAGLIALVGVLVHNILTYFKKKKEIEPYICSFNYIFSMISVLEGMEKSFTDPLFSKELETIRGCNRELKKFKTGSFLVMQQRNGDIGGNPLMILIDYACMTLFIDLLKFNHMLMVVRSNLETIESCLQIIGSLETDISIALYRASLVNGYCIPDFEGQDICAEKCYHPLLTDPVKNSISHAGNVPGSSLRSCHSGASIMGRALDVLYNMGSPLASRVVRYFPLEIVLEVALIVRSEVRVHVSPRRRS